MNQGGIFLKNPATETSLTKECIFTALTLLMEQKDFSAITITDIAKKAGVSRMTYYRTYSSKEDILIQHFSMHADMLLQEIKSDPKITYEKLCLRIFEFAKENAHLIQLISKAGLFPLLMDCIIELTSHLYNQIYPRERQTPALDYALHFVTGGIISEILHWVRTGLKETPEEMAKASAETLRNILPDLSLLKP